MNIKIHRGQNQIGGNIIEISSPTTRILLDVGLELDDSKNKKRPDVEGLFDFKGFDAVFISHYHSDHMGLAYEIFKSIPIYIGQKSFQIVKASDCYKGVQTFLPAGFMIHQKPIDVGDIKVTPFLCDHSAFDSFMILLESAGESILYTGDFRSNGRKPFNWLISELPKKVDVLICEGTTLSRDSYVNETESELEARADKIFAKKEGPIFILQSSMNIDRIVTMYRASKKCKRLFLQDLYMAEITSSLGGSIPNPLTFNDVKTFLTRPYLKEHIRYKLFSKYGSKKISKSQIASSKFVMCVRSSMKNYLKSLQKEMSFENGVLIYSFWSGYKVQPEMKLFLKECEYLGLEIETMHISGHADEDAIKELINHVNPNRIIPIHTENSKWFEALKLLKTVIG
ncbi:MAG: MBL fold metallo-hydrolase [Bacillota bacterium]